MLVVCLNFLLMAKQNLCLCLHLKLTQLMTQPGDCLVQLGQVKSIIANLLFHTCAINTDLAGMVHHVIQQLGLHPDLLTAYFWRRATLGLDRNDWCHSDRFCNFNIRVHPGFINCCNRWLFSICHNFSLRTHTGLIINFCDNLYNHIRFRLSLRFTACTFGNVFNGKYNVIRNFLLFSNSDYLVCAILLLLRHGLQRHFYCSCITRQFACLNILYHFRESIMGLM